MKLGPTTVAPVVSNSTRTEVAGAAADGVSSSDVVSSASATGSAASPGVPVSVSSLSSDLVQARQSTAADVDQKKVDAMRAAIANGSFKVNAGAIADKMLANAEEILQRQSN